MTELMLPPVSALVAARTYLLEELAARDNPLPVGIAPPAGEPQAYALLSRPGGKERAYLADYMIRLRVFDTDIVQLENNTDLLYRLLVSASHRHITTPLGGVWITAATGHTGPSSLDDPDVPRFGMQAAVFWTIGLRPEPGS